MNQLDMYSKEKAAKAHVDQMLRDAADGRRLRRARQEEAPKKAAPRGKPLLLRALSAMAAAVAALLHRRPAYHAHHAHRA